MPQISAIEPQKRREGRFNIYLDGEFAFGLGEDLLVRENLKVGQVLSDEKVEKLIEKSGLEKIFEKVFRFLSYRPRSEKEIKDYLKKKSLGEKEKELVLKRLNRLGYINDLEFTKFFIEGRLKFKPKGKRLLALELRKKGIEKEIIEKVLEEVLVSEIELAQRAIGKKIGRFLKLPQKEAREKIASHLLRRGFSWETVKTLIDRLGSVD